MLGARWLTSKVRWSERKSDFTWEVLIMLTDLMCMSHCRSGLQSPTIAIGCQTVTLHYTKYYLSPSLTSKSDTLTLLLTLPCRFRDAVSIHIPVVRLHTYNLFSTFQNTIDADMFKVIRLLIWSRELCSWKHNKHVWMRNR